MSIPVSIRIAIRELRGGLDGFRVFLACLALSVGAIAAVGTVRTGLELGMAQEGATILGGDAEIQLTYRTASEAERAWLMSNSARHSEIIDFRSMAVVNRDGETDRGLTQVKSVDQHYPLFGSVLLDPPISLDDALKGNRGRPGAVMDRVLAERLGLVVGETFDLGAQEFGLSAILVREPDGAGSGFSLGPRTIVRTVDLGSSGLLQPGTLFESAYRMELNPEIDLDALEELATTAIEGGGLRWKDRRNAAPGMSTFIERLSTFLILVGISGLAVGGVGVSAAVRAYLGEKVGVIATLKSIGAESRTIFRVYFLQIGVLSLLGIIAGLILGATVPALVGPLIEAQLPVPVVLGIQPRAMAEAAVYGSLTALLFTLWPLARTQNVRAAALFRDISPGDRGWPKTRFILLSAGVLGVLVAAAVIFSGEVKLTLWVASGICAAFLVLVVAAILTRHTARYLAAGRIASGRVSFRLALAAVGAPQSEATSVVLSLGLGLSVLAAVGQVDSNLRNAIAQDLPEIAPSYFVVDIQSEQLPGFLARLASDAGVSRVETAPMLRGIITRINGRPADEIAGDHWVVSGDRGITYAAQKPPGTNVTAGAWWPKDYSGDPQISFAAEEAEEIGLQLGDTLTVNILGREITASITSFREVDFSNAGMGFVLSMNPSAIAGAPHTHIATIYADEAAEAVLLHDLASSYPNITAIRVRDAIDRVSDILRSVAAAITYGAIATLGTGVVVLIGSAAAEARARTYEAAVLKTLGATRGLILSSFAIRSGIYGLAAGMVAVVAGGAAGWAISKFVMDTEFSFEPLSAAVVIFGGVAVTIGSGLVFSLRAINTKPAGILRARE